MKKLNLKIADGWNKIKWVKICLEIPEDLYFWVEKGYIGGGHKWLGTEHYTTIFHKDKYKEFQKFLNENTLFGVYIDNFCDYIIVRIENLCDKTPVPVKDREIILKENNINFNNMVFYHTSNDGKILSAFRILDFYHIDKVKCSIVTFRNIFEYELYSIDIQNLNLRNIYDDGYNSHYKTYVLYNEEADIFWNSMIYKINEKIQYNPSFVKKDYDFEKHERECEIFNENFLNNIINNIKND